MRSSVNALRTLGILFVVSLTWSNIAAAQSWTPLNHQPCSTGQPCFLPGSALLLTDGSVIVEGTFSGNWYRLTPDNSGSYVNGTWSQLASLPAGYSPLYFASAVLPDGRVIVEGGEFQLWHQSTNVYNSRSDLLASIQHVDVGITSPRLVLH